MNVNREDLAREALEKKTVLEDKKSSLLNEIEKIEKRIETIKANKSTLAEQITNLENKREELIAINKSADAQLAVKEIVAGVSNDITDLNEQIKRAEEKRQKELNKEIEEIEKIIKVIESKILDYEAVKLQEELQNLKKIFKCQCSYWAGLVS